MKPLPLEEFLQALLQVRDARGQRAFVLDSSVPLSETLTEKLSALIREILPKDPQLAESLSETNLYLADRLGTPLSAAYAHQCQGYVFMNMRQAAQAQPFLEKAGDLFAALGEDRELGRTLVSQSENLMSLGDFGRVPGLAARAKELLISTGDAEYLPRVHVALGNLFYRLNRFKESLVEYEHALQAAERDSQYIVVVAVEMNRAEALTELNRFDEAIQSYERARDYCVRHQISLWFDILDKNIADLYFKRGSYSEALRSLEKVRPRYVNLGDDRRLALCDLQRAEIYLQLNLPQEACELAESALEHFEQNSSPAEAAQCLALVGIAQSDRGEHEAAEGTFVQAEKKFRALGKRVQAAGVDLHRAKIRNARGEVVAAQTLATSAVETFEAEDLAVRGAYARLTVAEALHGQGRDSDAIAEANQALRNLSGYHAKWVSYQCYDLLGRLNAAQEQFEAAEDLYLKAVEELESLRGSLQLDEFRMSFGKDKYQVYENLVSLKLRSGATREAFQWIERSKSRTLIDLLERNTDSLWQSDEASPNMLAVQKLRQDLNGLYSRMSQVGTTVSALEQDREIQNEISRVEREMLSLLRAAGSEREGWAALETMPTLSIGQVQEMLSTDEVLIEYYVVEGHICAFVVGGGGFHFVEDLAPTEAVRDCMKAFSFQLSKFHLSDGYVDTHAERLMNAVRYHLHKLYRMLIAPLEAWLDRPSLVIIPHGVLHYVPFHALHDGSAYVVDNHDVVYGASASVLKICRSRNPSPMARDLVLAVPDDSTPAIFEEAEMLERLLSEPRVFVGEKATADVLREHGRDAGKLHIAAHGVFRADNPMFSSIRLGDSWFNLVDIFNLKLGTDLTTLSACETGMSALYEGDELLGLTRGFLYAGTPSLVVSLWRVSDRSTTLFMKHFYEGLSEGLSKPRSLRKAALEVKNEYPHPYYWAPFVLMGKS